MLSFDLTSRPWLPVQLHDGTMVELSLEDAFLQAGDIRRLVGDIPTQEFALLRLLLAVLHDAVDGPGTLAEWTDLWRDSESLKAVPGYLAQHRARFDLLHSEEPFFQVADLRAENGEISSLRRIVADVPNGAPFFSMRQPGVDRLSLAEAARWLVHAQAFDPAGIKSGAVGDPRVKGGKGYPQGVGWAGCLGGVFAEGDSLRATLLLNLVATEADIVRPTDADLPAWRRPRSGPGPLIPEAAEPRPSGPRDLYTWQSRRLRLHVDADSAVGVVLSYGDPLPPHEKQHREPLSGWRRSSAQEKKLGEPLVYMPLEHDPARAAWHGLAALLFAQPGEHDGDIQDRSPAASLPPGVVRWVATLATEEILPEHSLIRTRTVGAVYGTQQSVIDEVIDDSVLMPVVVLHEGRPEYGATAVSAVADAEEAVKALGALAGNLARAAGAVPDAPIGTARDLAFGALDTPYRQWLRRLADEADPGVARAEWQTTVRRIVGDLGEDLLNAAGQAAWEGRRIEVKGGGQRWLDDAQAQLWFLRRLNIVLSLAAPGRPSPDAS